VTKPIAALVPPPPPVRREEPLPKVEPAAVVPAPKTLPIEEPTEEPVKLASRRDQAHEEDATPLAIEPEVVEAGDEFSWPQETAADHAETATSQSDHAMEEIGAPSEPDHTELAKHDEPITIEPVIEPVVATPPRAPERQPEVVASDPEPIRFATAAPAEPEVAPAAELRADDAVSASDLGLLAADSLQDADLVDAGADDDDNDRFASLVDSLEVADDELERPSEPLATAAQPARPAGSNGNGAVSAAKKSAAAFTDEDIDAALNEALRQLDGLDDLSEAAAPARGRSVGR